MVNRSGRARDTAIDDRVLHAAGRHLAQGGYDAMSVASIAAEAGTTRQALYRRWPTKADLAAAVVEQLADDRVGAGSADPLGDLIRELTDFQRGVSRRGRLSLVGTMLQDTTDADVRARYRESVVAPRRRRIRAILERARALGMIDDDADFDVAVTMATGCWYGRELAGEQVPPDWPRRSATLVWRAVGGVIGG
ncbi:TetR/AcrR family transcriptional regulator [Antrihabitans cavernicola]|uniref:Helix-turn-helix transcriptional regulator n=1 Tax=Antrihabitans cavernicola TaxID=2495913 RepID=A0A5A7S8B1_9NOCA|nr:helix-turn-helix domain-containing protein [Spelaeibacter cavernicola]KAA0020114.1 helix-turn-helix transcriptional regulator [Spelaeibacter cavernicola]